MKQLSVRLLLVAVALLAFSGALFGFLHRWGFAVLLWVGAFGCAVAALNLWDAEHRSH